MENFRLRRVQIKFNPNTNAQTWCSPAIPFHKSARTRAFFSPVEIHAKQVSRRGKKSSHAFAGAGQSGGVVPFCRLYPLSRQREYGIGVSSGRNCPILHNFGAAAFFARANAFAA